MHCSTPLLLSPSPSLSSSPSPMWHKGLSYTPPLLSLCQEPSSVRLLLYWLREIHLARCTRWSVKTENPFILWRGAELTGSLFAAAFLKKKHCVQLAAEMTHDRRPRSAICFDSHASGLKSPAGALLGWCWQICSDLMFCESKNPPPSEFRDGLNFLAESSLDVGSQHF